MQTLSDFGVPEQPVATHRDVPGEPIQEQTKATIAVWFSVFFALLAVADISLQRSAPRQV
jgi:hypothetical protein